MGAGASAAKDKKEAIKEAFKALDKDGDGKMTKDEVKEFLQKEDKETFTDEVCDALYKDANPDGDGHISVKDFTEWLDKQEDMKRHAIEFLELWQTGASDEAAQKKLRMILDRAPLCGRVVKGAREEDFTLLSTNVHNGVPWKRLSWVFGPDALSSMLGKNARDVCIQLGMGNDWINDQLAKGTIFKLVIFPAGPEFGCLPATWENLEELIRRAYPEVHDKVSKQLPEIRNKSFDEIEREAGYNFLEVNSKGRDVDERYISASRLMEREGTLVEVRGFLWDELGCRNLFAGTGLTVEDDGSEGVSEYLVLNKPLAELQGCVMHNLQL